ncbi:MAG TPA: uroporphyrinogen decarboxylase family protein [Candidatus Latescibacteria bacterium]|nr:uroporphyrinogen decarboxylase family protein [Candidatus Latescibacterota bacterium]HJP32928.1 uroporphyrinogen decarboxylase family protein [Candidatus Latescibacterota bacterium]
MQYHCPGTEPQRGKDRGRLLSYIRPNYDTARDEAGFGWQIGGCYNSCIALSGVPVRDFYTRPEACIEVYRSGRQRMYEMFGDWLPPLAPATPPISYMHANCLGSELLFVDGGEVGHTHPFESLEAAITQLKEPVDFATSGDTPFYLDFWEEMKRAFPDENVGFSFGVEGPITTAWELRGEGFFTDLFDEPELVKEFLRLTTASIIDVFRFRAAIDRTEFPNPHGAGMVDDIASFIPAHMFEEFALPYWEQYYSGITTGTRRAHVEDLKRDQLRFLHDIGLSSFDPSISHQLNPPMLRDEIQVPFGWRLGSFHYRDLDEELVRDFLFQAAADGASSVFTIIEGTLSTDEGCRKVMAFKAAGEEAEQLLASGCSRQELGSYVSERGKARFWEHFPE